MTLLSYTLDAANRPPAAMGLIVLQADETIEGDFRTLFREAAAPLHVSRIPSGLEVTTDTLREMERALPAAAELFPKGCAYGVVGYGCTSASSVIGSETIEKLIRLTCNAAAVTDPLRAASTQAKHLGASRFALLSPYVETVSDSLRAAFAANGVSTDVFGTFGVAEEASVARISEPSIVEAAVKLGRDTAVDAVFLSCTNLRTLNAIPQIQQRIDKPVLSSNLSLAWHMALLNKGQTA